MSLKYWQWKRGTQMSINMMKFKNFFFTKRFYNHEKASKHSNWGYQDSFFYQKIPQAQKGQKKHKKANKWISDFFVHRCFLSA